MAPDAAASPQPPHMRRAPVQQRAANRTVLILDAAAQLIDEVGYHDLTTKMIADRTQMSIGSVYRYFPNGRSLVKALAERNFSRFFANLADRFSLNPPEGWWDMVEATHEAYCQMCVREPGFRRVRFGDVIDRLVMNPTMTSNAALAQAFSVLLEEQFEVDITPGLLFHLEMTCEVVTTIIDRAFLCGGEPDQRYLDECRRIALNYLTPHLPGVPPGDTSSVSGS